MGDISNIGFGQTVDLLSNAIHGSNMEQTQIANNLANVNTPNFRRSTTSFVETLAESMGTPASPDELAMVTNDDRQFALDGAQPPQPFDPQAHVDQTVQMRADRSNVDADQELAKLSENTGYEETMAQLLQEQYKFLRMGIQEQTN